MAAVGAVCEKHVFFFLWAAYRNDNDPSLPTAALEVICTMKGRPVSFSVFQSHISRP